MEVDDDTLEEIIETKLALNLEIDNEEMRWEQCAKANWIRYGDQNTKIFHHYASRRCIFNSIKGLRDENDIVREDKEEKLRIAVCYFQRIFKSMGCVNANKIYDRVEMRITQKMNEFLLGEFKVEGVKHAIQKMGSIDASGYDSFPVVEEVKVKEDITMFCIKVLNKEIPLDEISFT